MYYYKKIFIASIICTVLAPSLAFAENDGGIQKQIDDLDRSQATALSLAKDATDAWNIHGTNLKAFLDRVANNPSGWVYRTINPEGIESETPMTKELAERLGASSFGWSGPVTWPRPVCLRVKHCVCLSSMTGTARICYLV